MKRTSRILAVLLVLSTLLSAFAMSASASEDEMMTGIGIVKASALRLRASDTTSSSIKDIAYRGDYVVVVGKVGDWYEVVYNLQSGFMHGDYLTIKPRENVELGEIKVNSSLVNLRSRPTTASSIALQASKGAMLYSIGFNCGWYKVIYKGVTAYIRSDLADLTEIPYDNTGSTTDPKYFHNGDPIGSSGSGNSGSGNSGSTTSAGEAIVGKAKQYLGVPYVYGGASPSGFDCSGFTQYVFAACGYTINRTATWQLENGYAVSRSELKAGDLVFFEGTYTVDAPVSHVGIYIGGGDFIHSSNSGVSIDSLDSNYYNNHYACARRVVG